MSNPYHKNSYFRIKFGFDIQSPNGDLSSSILKLKIIIIILDYEEITVFETNIPIAYLLRMLRRFKRKRLLEMYTFY